MIYRYLGNTDIRVSAICLGTMTFGEQNTMEQGHEQLNRALDYGVNFIDTAEMYPVPPRKETLGDTERIIGQWLSQRKCRDKIVLASKVAGPGRDWLPYIRGGGNRLDEKNITAAIHDSLHRLNTDYIDLYQLHWPDRDANYFGKLGYLHKEDTSEIPLLDTLEAMSRLVEQGKVRHIGVSNETPWGVMRYLQLAEKHDLPKIVSIQNPYNLLNRSFEIGLAEISHREDVGLLAYSPMGFGVLSGKYLNDQHPEGARITLFSHYTRYSNPEAVKATEEYVALAKKFGIDPAQMALAFVTSRRFVTSNIIGATTMNQLEANLSSIRLELPDDLLSEIENIHTRHPNPSP